MLCVEIIRNMEGSMHRRAIMMIFLVLSLSLASAESRSASVDFIVLMDTSLSMAEAIEDARQYAAGEIVGRLVEPGDWFALISFYGQSEIVWQGDIKGQEEISTLVRSLNGLKATGRYTDIGAALDYMDKLINTRGFPDRPKYILLLTDERQEAPKDSTYYSTDYSIEHPLLEYVKRLDMGTFRVITVGYGLAAQVEGQARTLMTTLSDPPDRPVSTLPGEDAPQGAGSVGTGTGAMEGTSESTATEPGSASGPGLAPGMEPENASRYLPGALTAAGLAAAVTAGIIIAVIIARRNKKRDDKDEGKANPPESIT